MSSNVAKALLVFGALAIVFGVNILKGAFFMGTYHTNDLLSGGAFATIGFVLIAVGATGLGKRTLGLAIAAAGIGVGAWYIIGRVQDSDHARYGEQDQLAVHNALYRACITSGGIPDAAPLAALGHGIRKTIYFTHWDVNNIPRAWVGDERWRPARVADAQLVVCMETGADVIETCAATDQHPVILRKRRRVDGRLVEARTGNVISKHIVHGGLPDECAAAGERTADLVGSDPADDEVVRWTRPFIVGAEAIP